MGPTIIIYYNGILSTKDYIMSKSINAFICALFIEGLASTTAIPLEKRKTMETVVLLSGFII